jgi:hypothetical protein
MSNPPPVSPPPPAPIDSMAEATWLHDPKTPFWKPTWLDALKYLGWRWIFMLPLVCIVVGLVVIPFRIVWVPQLFVGGIKLILFVAGLAVTSAAYGIRTAIQSRTEPFCIHCGYDLTGLPDHHHCPECGRPFSLRLINEYRRDPVWFVERCRSQKSFLAAHPPFAAGPVRRKRKSRDGT